MIVSLSVCDHHCDSPLGTVPALPHSDTLEAVSCNILTGRISVTFTGQMVDGSLREPVEKLTSCLPTLGDSERGKGIQRISQEEGWVSGAKL